MAALKDFDGGESFKFTLIAAQRDVLLEDLEQCLVEGRPKAKVQAVLERGFKARIVTKSPAPLVALAHMVRHPVLEVLRKITESSTVLLGDRRKAVTNLFSESGKLRSANKRIVISADLTAASDALNFGLIRALWDVIEERFRLPLWAKKVVRLSIGPQ